MTTNSPATDVTVDAPTAPVDTSARTDASANSGDQLRKKLSQLMPQPSAASPSKVENTSAAAKTPAPVAAASNAAAKAPPKPQRRTQKVSVQKPAAPKQVPNGNKNGRIMIVDDEETNVMTVKAYLQRSGYSECISTLDSRKALDLIRSELPDLLLLDINMPHVSGIDILRAISSDSSLKRIPVIVLTAATDPEIKQQALSLGAADFLTKPVDPHDLIPRVRNSLFIKHHMDDMANQNAKLEELIKRRTKDLFDSRQQLILSLARAAEHRDDDTGNHVIRVGRYAGIIAKELGWSEQRVLMIEQAAQLHDVGKIGIPDSILFKPGKLDPDEWKLMREHCAIGSEIIEPLGGRDLEKLRSHSSLGAEILHMRTSPMMMMATRIAQTHHERWDGTGYPLGLAGDDMPIEGRVTAVADVFDALSSSRPYKAAFPREKCFEILEEGRESHFDPAVLDAFFAQSEEIVQVQMNLMDR